MCGSFTLRIVAISALVFAPGLGASAQAPPNAERLLTPADVEKASGLKGITAKKLASGDLSFALGSAGNVLLTVSFGLAADFAAQKKAVGPLQAVPGLGDEAYSLGDGTSLAFRKARYRVQLTSYFDAQTAKPFFSADQLRELGRVIASRM